MTEPEQSAYTSSKGGCDLALHLYSRFKQLGTLSDLEEALALQRNALELCSEGHRRRATSLRNLAIYLHSRFEQLGMLSDLEEALALERNALELFSEGHPDRALSLGNLALYLHSRFEQLGMLSDLEEALALGRNALELRSEGHPDRALSLRNLALYLHSRFEQLGMLSDLEEALALERNALELFPEGHPGRSTSLSYLALYLHSRFKQLRILSDLEEALALERNALELFPEGHPDRSTSLSNLALFLHSRFKQLGMLSDLEEALELQRNASELLPERHPDRAASLGSLAASLHSRFEQLETLCDPEEALALQRNALQLCPEGHPSDEVDVECILPHPSLRLDERQRIFELRLRKMLDLACSSGLRVPGDPIPSSLPVGVQNTPWTERASIADGDSGSMVASRIGSSTVFRSASSGDPKKIRKIDKIKQKLVEMLREIGFRLSNGRLPWSTLEGDLRKKGYTIVNWPQGVNRERDKGVFGISAEDADKLYDALFVGDHWIRFVRCEESACNDDGVTTLTAASGSDGPREHSHSSGGKQSRFRVTTAAEYPNKRRRV